MTKLTALDNMFLLMDNPEQKMHILAYVTFEKPRQCAENYVEKLVEEIRQIPGHCLTTINACIDRFGRLDDIIG